jgi:hypothetical protein
MIHITYPLPSTYVYYDDDAENTFHKLNRISKLRSYRNRDFMVYDCGASWNYVYPVSIIQEHFL